MLANLPRGLVRLHHEATLAHLSSSNIDQRDASNTFERALWEDTGLAAYHVASAATELLSAATWHPWLSAPRRLWRTRQLSDIYAATDPGRPPSFNRRRREKKIKNDAIRAISNARDLGIIQRPMPGDSVPVSEPQPGRARRRVMRVIMAQ
jgi:hypothetical protein